MHDALVKGMLVKVRPLEQNVLQEGTSLQGLHLGTLCKPYWVEHMP